MARRRSVHVFAGPSAHGLPDELRSAAGLTWHAPARRDDVQALVQQLAPGVLVLADGVFQLAPAVSHAELCAALDSGWQVWGVSSLGAIRAHEMRHEGMHGFGWVYQQFALHDDFTDDELCLLHFPEPPWWPVTEALVNLRYALHHQPDAAALSADAKGWVVAQLRQLWFGERSAACMQALLQRAGLDTAAASRCMAWLGQNRIKSLDLAALLRAAPWARR